MGAFQMRQGILIAGLLASTLPAMAQDVAASAAAPAFDVVSIKLHDKNQQGSRIMMGDNSYTASNVSVKNMMVSAYGVKSFDQVLGLPAAIEKMNFDVEAKMDADTVAARKTLTPSGRAEQQSLLLQAMLEDRLKLKVHHESREMSMYALVIAKGGLKVKEADPNDTYANGIKGPDGKSKAGFMMIGNGTLKAQAIPMENLARNMQNMAGRIVVDKTGLTGKYDIELKWTPEGKPSDAADAPPGIFTALEEQVGVKLEPFKGPVDVVVVDHVEMPTEN